MKTTKRILSLILVLVTMCSMLAMPAYAASNWPGLSSSSYCEMVAFADIPVYRDTGLSTRGTSSPAKSYNAYISKNDKIFIYQITGSYCVVNYPTSSGRRTGMVSTKQLLGVNAPTEKVTARAKVTTYTGASTSVKSGSIAVGDAVYKLGTTKSGFALVIYTAVSGSRAYKAAFITKSDYERVKGNSISNTENGSNSSVQARLDAIGNGSKRYDDRTTMKIGCKFTGTRADEQCKGYAKNVFYLCFGIVPGSTQPRKDGKNYLIYNTSGMTRLGSVTNMTNANISALFGNARPGDFVQMRRSHGGSHSAIVYSVSSNGVTFLEANLDGKNTVYLKSYSWADLCSKNAAMSVYTASNYRLK